MTDGSAVDGDDSMPCGETDREPAPSDSRRTFGAVLQALREHAGYNRAQFAELVSFSKHTVESVELGRRMPDVALVECSEEALGNTGALRRSAKHVTRGRGDVGLAAWFRQWARLERVAVGESVFRRQLGGAEVMRELIGHVLELTAPRNVVLQIMPLSTEAHACLDGPVQLLETPRQQRLAYSEGQQNGRLISDLKEVSLLCQRYDTLRSQALNPRKLRGCWSDFEESYECDGTGVVQVQLQRHPGRRLRRGRRHRTGRVRTGLQGCQASTLRRRPRGVAAVRGIRGGGLRRVVVT
ncbi:hypothetical protein SUDANB140_02065 [Streptomyces sp. enrichment culture]